MDAIDNHIITLRKQGLGYKSIAKSTGMSVGGVRKRVAKLEGALKGGSKGVLEVSATAQNAHSSNDLNPHELTNTRNRNKTGAPKQNQNAVTHGGYAASKISQILEDQDISSQSPEWEFERVRVAGELALQSALETENEHIKIGAIEALGRNAARAHTIRKWILSAGIEKDEFRKDVLIKLQNSEITAREAALALEVHGIEVTRTVLELLRNELATPEVDDEGGITEEELDRIVSEGQIHQGQQKAFLEERRQWIKERFQNEDE